MEDLVIVGSGPAGLAAGLYAARAGLGPLVLEGLEPGGQLVQTAHVANYPGVAGTVTGSSLVGTMRAQAESAGARFVTDVVTAVDFGGTARRLMTMLGNELEARAVIIASGAGVTRTGLPGEARFWGHGISACLSCDGAFYAGKRTVIVGEGSASVGARSYLERCGAEVAAVVAPADLASFDGEGTFAGVTLRDGTRVAAAGAFLVTARTPQTSFLGDAVARDARGYVVTDGVMTSVRGVFAAGDCARPDFKQAVIAAGDGATAALEAIAFLAGRK